MAATSMLFPRLARRNSSRFSGLMWRSMSFGVPEEPKNFGKLFHIEPYRYKLDLETFHSHPRDKHIVYDDEQHCYYFNGSKMETSVTRKVDSYFKKFEADIVADKMMSSKNWPREGYKKKDGTPFTKQAILEKWESNGMLARNSGTWLHYNIERYFNNLAVSPHLDLTKFYKFENSFLQNRGIKPYRTEWKIVGEDENIGGTVDFVGKKPDGTFIIIDWKTTANLAQKFANAYGEKAKEPLDHLDDCDGLKYALQLNIYRFILQKYYGIVVSEMRLVSFAYKEPTSFSTVIHIMDDEIDLLFPPSDDELMIQGGACDVVGNDAERAGACSVGGFDEADDDMLAEDGDDGHDEESSSQY